MTAARSGDASADRGVPRGSAVPPREHVAEPEELVDGSEDEVDTSSRLSMVASDPPSSWAGADTPPADDRADRADRTAPADDRA
jgi:hypothetical protein